MTKAALEVLEKNPNGFLLQVEGGRVDHAAHANDAGAIFPDQVAFDDAMEVVLDFVERNPDTLMVVTTDHGNSNPGLTGMGPGYTYSTLYFERLTKMKGSYDELNFRLGNMGEMTIEKMKKAISDLMLIDLSDEEANDLVLAYTNVGVHEINVHHKNFTGILGQVLGNHTGIFWTGNTHTEDYAIILTKGAGQEMFTGLMKNTDAFEHFGTIFGFDYRNPTARVDKTSWETSSLLNEAIENNWA